jgi:hypothetical protein
MSMQFYSILLHLYFSVLTVDRASPLLGNGGKIEPYTIIIMGTYDVNISSPLFVCCLFSRVPEGRMTVVSSRSHASCRVWARTHRREGSHKATRHAARGRQDQFLTMRYNTGLTAAPASPLYGSPVCLQVPRKCEK